MPPELAEAREWVRKAEHDRVGVEAALGHSPPLTDVAAFHCQQAVEKYLKAYLVYRGEPFEKVHDLSVLLDQCVRLHPAWEGLHDRVEPLTGFAVRFRYPGPADPTVEEVRAAVDVVEDVRRIVAHIMPQAVD